MDLLNIFNNCETLSIGQLYSYDYFTHLV